MVIEDGRHHAGTLGDVLHLRGVVAEFREDRGGSVEDADSALFGGYPLPCHTE
jgi:hypothetical protein